MVAALVERFFGRKFKTRNAAPPEFAKAADFVVVQSQRVRSNILLRAHTAPRAFFSARRRAAFSAQCARVLACVWRCPGQQRVFFLQRCAAAQLCSLIKHLQDPKMQALKKSCCLSFSRRRPLLMPCRLACATQLGFAPRCCGFQTRGSSQSSRRHLNARVWRRFVSPVGEHKRCSNEQTKHTRNHSYMCYSYIYYSYMYSYIRSETTSSLVFWIVWRLLKISQSYVITYFFLLR